MQKAKLAKYLATTYGLLIKSDSANFWQPEHQTVHYDHTDNTEEGIWALLHESGHALLSHMHYQSDLELVLMETAAWEKAKQIARALKIEIDDDYIQDCLDSYREWLHKRSLCPDCQLSSVQINPTTYSCPFCHKQWSVTSERFCRPYRRKLQPNRKA